MESRINILNELREISPTIAEIGYVNPYKVPQGYFEGLAEKILLLVKDQDTEVSTVLQGAMNNPYTVPHNYFDNLAASILKKVKAQNTDSAKEELEILSPLLSSIGKKTPFSTPAGYFDELTDNAVAGAKAIEFVNDELENLSPVMNELKKKQVYEVPAGYFDNLPVQILNKVKAQQPAKVVSMNFGRKVMRYAAAAVIAGAVIIGGWFYLNNGTNPTDGGFADAGLLKEVTDTAKVSDVALQSYLENQDVAIASNDVSAAKEEIGENDMKDMLADVSDDELAKYIEQYSNPNNSKDITN